MDELSTVANVLRLTIPRNVVVNFTFLGYKKENHKWNLRVHPNGVDEQSKDYISLFLTLVSGNKSEVWAKVKLYIFNQNRDELFDRERETVKFVQGHDWGYKQFVRRDSLYDTANGPLPEDKLIIFYEVSVITDSVNISGQSNAVQFKVPESRLPDVLGQMFENQMFSDITFSVSGIEISAHKAILAARSPVFARMFQQDMLKDKHNPIIVSDIDHKVFQEMLRFMYTGKATNLKKMSDKLLAAADKYELQGLKIMCEESFCTRLCTRNAVKILILADSYNAEQLKKTVLTFINTHAIDVMKTPGWKDMTLFHSHLISEAYCALATQQIPPNEPPCKRAKKSQ